jgi:hypothetical protein
MQALKIAPRTECEDPAYLATRDHLRAAAAALRHVTCPKVRAEAAAKLKQIIKELQDKGT